MELMKHETKEQTKLAVYKTGKNILEFTTDMLEQGRVRINLAVNNEKTNKREAMYSAYLSLSETKALLTSIINGTMLGLREEVLAKNPKFGTMYHKRGGNDTTYRYFSVKPGTSGEIKYRIEIGEGEGERDAEGKVNPKKGVKIPYSVVGLTHWDMTAFAVEALDKLECFIQEKLQTGYNPYK